MGFLVGVAFGGSRQKPPNLIHDTDPDPLESRLAELSIVSSLKT